MIDRLYIESQLIEYGINIDKLTKHHSIEELYIAVEELKQCCQYIVESLKISPWRPI